MKRLLVTLGMVLAVSYGFVLVGQSTPGEDAHESSKNGKKSAAAVSYAKDVAPVIGHYCLPCHTEDEMNPSLLYLDGYESLMHGGKHGSPVKPGQPDSSFLVQKISFHPPFGDPMPLKRKVAFPADTLEILKAWIKQGAKNN